MNNHHTVLLVIRIVAVGAGRGTAARFINITMILARIESLIHRLIIFSLPMFVKAEKINLNSVSNLTDYWGVAQKQFLI